MSNTSEIGEAFAAYNHERKLKKLSNKESSLKILSEEYLSFELKNDGSHVIIKHNGKTCDFWPSTGRWIIRNGKDGRGVIKMIRELK